VATHAWPYAVSRDDRSGYQAVVVPEFLADAGQAYVLEYASKGQASKPGTVIVREICGAVTEPLSLAYRVTETRADRDEPGGDEAPEDRAGRTTRVFEGLVLQVSAEQVASLGLTVTDLDAVASITAPAFSKLRAAGALAEAESSAAISVGDMGSDAPLLDLQIAKPWVMPGSGRHLGARPGGQGAVPLSRRPDGRRREPADAHPGRNALIVVAVIVCALAGLLVWYLTYLLPKSPPPVQASAGQWCSEISNGEADDVYSQTSGPYQQSTSLPAFESRLFGSGHSATCTSAATQAGHASLSLRGADGLSRTVDLYVQDQGGHWRITSVQVSP
jgi:hypothetical protein